VCVRYGESLSRGVCETVAMDEVKQIAAGPCDRRRWIGSIGRPRPARPRRTD
jgi:hypothetical protein